MLNLGAWSIPYYYYYYYYYYFWLPFAALCSMSGKSDPSVKIFYGGETGQTAVVRKSLDPQFDEEFEFVVTESSARTVLFQVNSVRLCFFVCFVCLFVCL